jgi:hypothetical protein
MRGIGTSKEPAESFLSLRCVSGCKDVVSGMCLQHRLSAYSDECALVPFDLA